MSAPVWGLSGTGGPASSHAADPARMTPGGFAPALCRRDIWVLVDHVGNVPVLAVADTAGRAWDDPPAESPGCNRCRLHKLAA